jgi:hypothetical protein
MSLLKNIKFQILLFSLTCTLIIFIFNKRQNYSFKLAVNLRNLIINDKMTERCQKAEKNFLDKYNSTDYPKPKNETFEGLDKYQDVLKNMIQEKKFGLIKKYLPKIVIFAAFLVVDVLLIIFWFLFCGCSFCAKKRQTSFGGCSNCYYILFFIFSIATIIICAYGIIKSPGTYNSLNGVICSIHKLVFHFIEGTNNEIPDSNWIGLNQTLNLIDELSSVHIRIDKQSEQQCSEDNGDICNLYNETIDALKTDSDNVLSLNETKKNIESFYELFNSINNRTLDDLELAMGYLDKYFKLGLLIIFLVLMLLCFFGFISLFFYCCSNCDCLGCLFHLFWNIEMFVIIVSIIIGVAFGITGVISKDLDPILNYAITNENLKNENPFYFKFSKDDVQAINICFNGDGDLYSSLFKPYIDAIQNISNDFKTGYSNNKITIDSNSELKKNYEALKTIIDDLDKFRDDLNEGELNCTFFEKDFQILLEELKEDAAKKLTFFALVIIIADLAAVMSIIVGTTIVNNYKKNAPKEMTIQERHIKMQPQGSNRKMDSSSDNLKMKK